MKYEVRCTGCKCGPEIIEEHLNIQGYEISLVAKAKQSFGEMAHIMRVLFDKFREEELSSNYHLVNGEPMSTEEADRLRAEDDIKGA